MASSSVLRIDVLPDDEDAVFTQDHTPAPPPQHLRRRRANTDSALLCADLHTPPPPPPPGPHARGRGASSGYMSSCSNVQSPRNVIMQPHPHHLHRPLPSHSPLDHEELLSDYSTARQYSSSNYYQQREYEATLFRTGIYSRLEHSNTSTLTRNTPTGHRVPWTPPTSLQDDQLTAYHVELDSHLVDHVIRKPRHAHQRSLEGDHMIPRSHHAHQRSLEGDHVTPRSHHAHQRSLEGDHMTPRSHHTHQRSLEDHMTPRSHHAHQQSLDAENLNPNVPPPSSSHSNPGFKRQQSPPKTPLVLLLRTLEGLDGKVKRWLIKADQHLKWAEFENAIPYLESAIVHTRVYPSLQLILWELLGNAQMALGRSKKASICHLHHLAYSRAQGDQRGVARAECNLGISYMQLGLFKLAGRCFLQYLKNCRSLQDDYGVESACSNLGLLSKTLALKNYRAAMERGEEGPALTSLTTCLRRAIIFFKQHLEVVLTHGEMDKEGRAYGNIGSCYELLRDYPEAIFYHKKRLEVVRAIGDMHSELCTLCNLGNCFRAKGDLPQALEHYQMDLEMAQSLGDEGMEKLVQHNCAITYKLLKQPDKAISCYTLYLGMVVQSGDVKKQAEGFSSLARLYLETGQTVKAHEYTHNLIGVLQKLGDHASLNSAHRQLKFIARLMKQEKKRKRGRGSHTHPKQGRIRAHTISRASNLQREVPGHTPSESRAELVNYNVGTWSTGKGPHPPLNFEPVEDLGPDPLLMMADLAPLWEGHLEAGLELGSTGRPLAHHGSCDHRRRSCDQHRRSCDQRRRSCDQRRRSHDQSYRPNTESRSLGSLSSCSSGSYDQLSPPDSAHPVHYSQSHAHPSEALYSHSNERGRADYELVGPPITPSDADLGSTGRSTALPPFSYSSSLSPSPSGVCGSEDKGEGHMRELQRAGLELARYVEGGGELEGEEEEEEGTDKEWEQWQQINEEQQGVLFGSLASMAGTQQRGPGKKLHPLRLHTTVSAPNLEGYSTTAL